MEIPKDYDPLSVEPKWQKYWERLGIHRFRRDDYQSPTYVIDTPPPYPSGEFHMGTALNWTYFDIVARYKRMRGFNVLFPQGWDCHGLPTEVQVEKKYGIRKGDLPPDKFRELCVKLTTENIAHMKEEMNSFGFSIDWSTEYRTMDPSYYGKTQLSFVQLYKKGLIYRGEHPVNWCPRCETAIADAEVEYQEKMTTLYYIKFKMADNKETLLIATTRPEYLPACVAVAVHPEDQRYREYVGKKLEVPPLGRSVEIIEDGEVDPNFGTGVVMICTFGDKTDVRWVKRYKLPVINLIDEKGRMTDSAGKYSGITIDEARRSIVEDLRAARLIEKMVDFPHTVGSCWRCKTPVEILNKPQWFMNVLSLNERAIEEAKKIRWIPEYMITRFIDWVKSMDWDWVISRQRIFATPIPAWYCTSCKQPIVADENQLPVNPAKDPPPVKSCPNCGNPKFEPERDVLDTWMDSSITIAVHAGWPDLNPRLFPADLQPNGTDIIRTWDYYLMVRHLALLDRAPYRAVLINGMVLGSDGRAMHKSLGNYVDSSTARDKYGADALRQWAAIGASTGADIPFSWKDVEFGYRFLRKFWNAIRFASPHLKPEIFQRNKDEIKMRPVDRWLLSRLNRLIKNVTGWLEDFQFNRALSEIHNFVWHELCDMYIEEVKHRLYGNDQTSEGAAFTLCHVMLTATKLLAPFVPHFAEEVYQTFFTSFEKQPSIHTTKWPEPDESAIDESAERLGEIVNSVVSALRQFKSTRKMPLNTELPELIIYTPVPELAKNLEIIADDIAGTMQVREIKITSEKPELEERLICVEPNFAKLGSRLRGDLKAVVESLQKAKPEELASQLKKGKITVKTTGREIELSIDELKITRETVRKGHRVEVIDLTEPALTLLVPLGMWEKN
ncbi:MAG: valine--tRNA ligase [Candidatus Hadarchaeum sp.]|uniref:valine--tRNA ligase n=1 Tax=Candidatus Hadarchaeum sp. TaxID=2883567 RepID=UPI003D0F78D1